MLNAVKKELENRGNQWKTLCKLPYFSRYEEIRDKIEVLKQKVEDTKPVLAKLQAEYDAVPDNEHGLVYLWAKMLKCKIKYKLKAKYKNMLRYEEALYDFKTKRTKRKLKLGELYEVKNQYELYLTSIKSLENAPEYKEINAARQAIKAGQKEDIRHLDFFIYTHKEFDASIYSYETLIGFKNYLQKQVAFDQTLIDMQN